MSKKIEIKLNLQEDLDKFIKDNHPVVKAYRILSKSLDARGAPRGKPPVFQYSLEVIEEGESFIEHKEEFTQKKSPKKPPIFIGAGPTGLFGALRLTEYGVRSIIIERGAKANKRMLDISKFWRKGIINPESNVCFGEGGAGLFSDGKLITRIKSPFVKYVMQKFVDFGAPADTAYTSNPHLGSNKIRNIIIAISAHLKEKGCEFRYNTRVDNLIYEDSKVIGVELSDGEKIYSDHVVMAMGHSAHDMYHELFNNNVAMSAKDFAVGVRIEHPRRVIDSIQYGEFKSDETLGAARYRLSYHNKKSDKGTYSFCMCPGGHALSSGTDADGIVTNGMSNLSRNSPWSNSALVVSVERGKDFSADNVMAGLEFQRSIEKKAYNLSIKHASGKEMPAITVKEFLLGRINQRPLPKTSCPSKLFKANFAEIFPSFIINHLKIALSDFDKKMKGFTFDDAVLIAPESRTSAPITILRDKETLESTSHKGLYPCGEGAGYAGGITSSAVDGIRVVECIVKTL
jgi:uncharacterized protein